MHAIPAGIAASLVWGMDREGPPALTFLPQAQEPRALRLWSWAVGLKTMVVAICLCLLGRDRPTDAEESSWVMAPWRRSNKPSAFYPATTNSTCWRPSASRQSASSHRQSTSHHRKLAQNSLCTPWKKWKDQIVLNMVRASTEKHNARTE